MSAGGLNIVSFSLCYSGNAEAPWCYGRALDFRSESRLLETLLHIFSLQPGV